MKRSEINLPEYFDRYILKCDDVTIMESLETSLKELESIPLEKWKSLGDEVYAPGKWTIKDILQHVIDTERVFAFRALSFARGDRSVPSMEEDEYAKRAQATNRTIDDLLEEAVYFEKARSCCTSHLPPKCYLERELALRVNIQWHISVSCFVVISAGILK